MELHVYTQTLTQFASCPDWVEERGLGDEDWVNDRWGD